MRNVFKAGGDWVSEDGTEYTVKSVNDVESYLADGWKLSLSDVKSEVAESGVDGGDYERQIRDKIKALGGKPDGRSSIERLEMQLAELESKAGL